MAVEKSDWTAPAHLFQPGDLVIILSMSLMDEAEITTLKPQVVFVDDQNQVLRVEEHDVVIQEQEVKPYE